VLGFFDGLVNCFSDKNEDEDEELHSSATIEKHLNLSSDLNESPSSAAPPPHLFDIDRPIPEVRLLS